MRLRRAGDRRGRRLWRRADVDRRRLGDVAIQDDDLLADRVHGASDLRAHLVDARLQTRHRISPVVIGGYRFGFACADIFCFDFGPGYGCATWIGYDAGYAAVQNLSVSHMNLQK